MIQQGPAQYLAGTSINITNTFAYSGQMLSLLWRVQLPAGWTLKAVSGDGNPEKMGTEIIWTGSLAPSPIQMVYTVEIPANEAGPWVQVDTTPATDSTKNVVVIDSGAVNSFGANRYPPWVIRVTR